MKHLALALVLVLLSPSPAAGADEAQDDLAWLAGSWCATDDSQQLEETWLMPRRGEAIGMSRIVQGGRMISFEYMRIMEVDGVVRFVAQPNGVPPTEFRRSAGGKGWIRFENKAHDFPQRIEYRREGEDLHAEIGGPGEGDKEAVIPYRYRRCPQPG
jgi:hypothetical protein